MLGRLRAACAGAGYGEEALRERLAPGERAGFAGAEAVQRRRLAGEDRLAMLARLFWLGDPVGREAAARALDPAAADELALAGLIAVDGDEARARFRITPHDGLLLASDLTGPAGQRREVVGGPNTVAGALDRLTIRREVGAALDLGTGGGIQALLASRHAHEVVGVDVNPRALGFAAFNADLNEIENASWALGSWLEPVAERRFDLILANPPYVVSPDDELLYRDSGQPADTLCRTLVEEIPASLADDGIAQVLCDWIGPSEGDWAEPVRAWVAGSGCEVLLLRLATRDPLTYAAGWNEPLLAGGVEAFERTLDRWLDYYRRLGIGQITWGLVVLRKRSDGVERVHAVDAAGKPSGPCGEHVLRLLDAPARLALLGDDESLLDEPLQLVAGHRVDQTLADEHRSYRSHPARIRILPGLPVAALVDPDALDVLFECDGSRPLGSVVAEVADHDGRDREQMTRVALDAARELVRLGMVDSTAGQ